VSAWRRLAVRCAEAVWVPPVCARVFDQIYATLTESDKKETTKIEAKIGKFCDQQSEGEVRVFRRR
jgi:hypothetical protein